MSESNVAVSRRMGGTRVIPAAPTPVPGLWVGDDTGWGASDRYVIVHKHSGRIVGRYAHPEAALACAREIGPLADWDVEVTKMCLPSALCDRIDAIVKRWGGDGIEIAGRGALR